VNMPLDECRDALARLASPDPLSRTPDEDGRRIVPLREGGYGWRLVNHGKYRDLRNQEARREQNREAQRRRRARAESPPVSTRQHASAVSAPTATATATAAKKTARTARASVSFPPALDTPKFRETWERWLAYRKEANYKRWTSISTQAALAGLAQVGVEAAIATIELSIANNWQGLFPERFRAGGRRGLDPAITAGAHTEHSDAEYERGFFRDMPKGSDP
jgi:hypothetical protein